MLFVVGMLSKHVERFHKPALEFPGFNILLEMLGITCYKCSLLFAGISSDKGNYP